MRRRDVQVLVGKARNVSHAAQQQRLARGRRHQQASIRLFQAAGADGPVHHSGRAGAGVRGGQIIGRPDGLAGSVHGVVRVEGIDDDRGCPVAGSHVDRSSIGLHRSRLAEGQPGRQAGVMRGQIGRLRAPVLAIDRGNVAPGGPIVVAAIDHIAGGVILVERAQQQNAGMAGVYGQATVSIRIVDREAIGQRDLSPGSRGPVAGGDKLPELARGHGAGSGQVAVENIDGPARSQNSVQRSQRRVRGCKRRLPRDWGPRARCGAPLGGDVKSHGSGAHAGSRHGRIDHRRGRA